MAEDDGSSLPPYEGGRDADGRRHGKGIARYPNGDVFEGTYQHGKRDGSGSYTFKNGASYVGSYKNNKKHGAGKLIYPDGSAFDGDWRADKRHGQGKYQYKNGDVYDGGWKMGERHGKGVYFFQQQQCQFFGARAAAARARSRSQSLAAAPGCHLKSATPARSRLLAERVLRRRHVGLRQRHHLRGRVLRQARRGWQAGDAAEVAGTGGHGQQGCRARWHLLAPALVAPQAAFAAEAAWPVRCRATSHADEG